MTGLTNNRFTYVLTRVLSVALVVLAGAVFLFVASTGFYTWKQSFYEVGGAGIETFFAAVELLIFFPGITPLLAAFYFFIYLKSPIYNWIGALAMIPIVFVHFLVSVPATHSDVFIALGISGLELLVVVSALWLFNKFIVHADKEEKKIKGK